MHRLFLIEPDQRARYSADPLLGTALGGKYPILGVIGEGGMGRVYRSIQPIVDRPVAIKMIKNLGAAHEAEVARFLREARLVASLDHPGVVTVLDFGVEGDGALYMVQELLVGESLRKSLKVLPAPELVGVVIELLGALGAAHRVGLVHRDIKPDNVMLLAASPTRPRRVKLLDFGIAKRLDDPTAERLTRTGAIFGTPAYMSPEQVNSPNEVDGRADLWAVGVTLYEALSGALPFTGPLVKVLTQVGEGRVPPMVPKEPIPTKLAQVVDRALRPDPADRFATAEAMADELAAIDWPTAEVRASKWPREVVVGLVGVGLVGLLVGAGGLVVTLAGAPPDAGTLLVQDAAESRAPERPIVEEAEDPRQEVVGPTPAPAPQVEPKSPSKKRVVRSEPKPRRREAAREPPSPDSGTRESEDWSFDD